MAILIICEEYPQMSCCGQFGNYGTGAFQVVLDMKEMEKLDAFDVDVSSVQESIEKGFEKRGTMGDCSKSDITIQNNIANISKDKTGNVCDDGYNIGF